VPSTSSSGSQRFAYPGREGKSKRTSIYKCLFCARPMRATITCKLKVPNFNPTFNFPALLTLLCTSSINPLSALLPFQTLARTQRAWRASLGAQRMAPGGSSCFHCSLNCFCGLRIWGRQWARASAWQEMLPVILLIELFYLSLTWPIRVCDVPWECPLGHCDTAPPAKLCWPLLSSLCSLLPVFPKEVVLPKVIIPGTLLSLLMSGS
jgi:hypothetical protein